MIIVTTTRAREDRIAGLRARVDTLLRRLQRSVDASIHVDVVYAGAAPVWWQRIASQADQAGAVLVLDKAAERAFVVMPLATAETLAATDANSPRSAP